MAPKRQPKIQDLPPAAPEEEEEASSDDETEVQDSSDEDLLPQQPEQPKSDSDPDDESEEEEEEEEEEEAVEKTPSSQTHQSPLKSESTEGSDSESDSDSDSKALNSPTASAFQIKPISTKPIPNSPEPKKVTPKWKASAVSKNKNGKVSNGDGEGGSIEEKKSAKRPAETEQACKNTRGKKSKIANGDESGESVGEKKAVINRGWSENGEIALLQGMIDYKLKKGADPLMNLPMFHEFIKDLVGDDVTKAKLSDKMRRLKKKYQTNAEKGQNGEDPVFSKPFECKSFELSKKLWGGEGSIAEVSDTKVKSSRKKKDKKDDNVASKSVSKSVGNKEIVSQEEINDEIGEDEEEKTDLLSLFPHLSSAIELDTPTYSSGSKDYIKEIISSLGKEKATELEVGWKIFRVMEYELRVKKAEMMLNQTKALLDVMKPSKA